MKQEIITALTFPRTMIESQRDLEQCPYPGLYIPKNLKCGLCTQRFECTWLYSNDEFVASAEKDDALLLDALEFAIHYVSATAIRKEHDLRTCACEICTWIKQAEALLNCL